MTSILIVDDSRSQREMMRLILKDAGYQVVMAAHGEDALAKMFRYSFDLVILDVVMPKINGYEVCRALRRHNEYQNLPVIFCSTQGSEVDRYWGLKQGANAYIAKPFKPQDLLSTIDALLASV